MKPEVARESLKQAADWDELHRWERRELGRALRRQGLTYSEIRQIIPVPKSTLSDWCHSVSLTQEQVEAIKDRMPTQEGVPRNSQWRRRLELDAIKKEASQFALSHIDESDFVAGVVLYWAEGSKTRNDLMLANTDFRALRLFVRGTRKYLDPNADFVLSLHLHEGNDEHAAKAYWRDATMLPEARFTKTFIKPRGTGHRKNSLEHGVCRVRVMKPADHWNRIMAWIEVTANHMGAGLATLAPGR